MAKIVLSLTNDHLEITTEVVFLQCWTVSKHNHVFNTKYKYHFSEKAHNCLADITRLGHGIFLSYSFHIRQNTKEQYRELSASDAIKVWTKGLDLAVHLHHTRVTNRTPTKHTRLADSSRFIRCISYGHHGCTVAKRADNPYTP